MAKTSVLTPDFSLGMRQDEARELLDRRAAWNLVDYIPNNGAPLRKRGGYVYASPDISTVSGGSGATYIQAIEYAPFVAGSKLCAIDEDAELYTIASSSSATHIGTAASTIQAPFFFVDKMIITNSNGTSRPTTYDGVTTIDSTGYTSGFTGKYGTTYKNRTLVANSSAHPSRVNFSDPAAFTFTSTAWLEADGPVQGIAGLRNVVILFIPGRTQRLRGSTPPGSVATDMVLEPIFDQGVLDARSIVNFNDYIVFANGNGIFLTDGIVIQDLTKVAGMVSYWRTLMSAYTTSWTIAAGSYRNHYVVSVMNAGTFVDAFLLNLDRRTMVRVSNLPALCFSPTVGNAIPELYFGSRTQPRVGSLSSYWAPTSAVKNDANGTAVAPVWESAFSPLQGKIRIHDLYLGYDMRDAASDNPTLSISYSEDPSRTYSTPVTVAETTAYTRARVPIRARQDGFGFKIAQTNASSDTRINKVEIDGFAEEQSRVA